MLWFDCFREKLSIASSARDFAIAEFEKLVNKANEHLSQGSNDESCLQISTEVFEALQILNCYVMRRVKRASIRKGFNYHNSRDNSNIMASTSVSDELDSYETPCENKSKYSEQYQLRITSIDNGIVLYTNVYHCKKYGPLSLFFSLLCIRFINPSTQFLASYTAFL